MQKIILAIDDEPNNLNLLLQVMRDKYRLVFANNGAKGLELASRIQPDLILLDIMMPGLDGYEVCRRLKADARVSHIPVIFLTAMTATEDEARGFDAGAVDYVQKPISVPILLRRVATHLSLVHLNDVTRARREAVYMLGEAGHYNDNDTGAHIWRMAAYACTLARALGWSQERIDQLELAAPLHDTGKIGVPSAILKAPRALTPDEWVLMKRHTEIGAQILQSGNGEIFAMARDVALSHHERWDGGGYPHGLAGEDIPEAARLVAVADVFDALTMQRPYKKPWSLADTCDYIRAGKGQHFDPNMILAFEQSLPELMRIRADWSAQQAQEETAQSRH
ncbi:HD-GYP domain-containing protein [Duganella qianjiadongensis]|uniref:Response regulator n=1 Tax=Duganella qianjiadongensis TaxID=2692176 RepID=A0ABW9VJC5_9BURK|nr:HD domain-containing phosphohydrolase [Duganella qianjiadongensis]MYM39688.1 response regulator [Duganella qianjiadongensis]